ncbi:glycosyltransferase family 32 protein [Streptomyces sp. enrichment culture]|uniref:glycosyltransferase family 32 protein n=1 Tax=Streptomyces sp. enrichment culture TaxID=1795815 RepID=UPI003F5432B1
MNKIIHRYWSGPDMPQRYRDYGSQWADMNPGWTVHDWTDADLPPLANQRVYDQLADGAVAPVPVAPEVAIATQRGDVIGYELVHRFGGIYINCDLEPLRSIDGQLPDTAWAAFEDANWLNNGAIGAPGPGSPFWATVIAELPHRFDRMPGQPFNRVTGPYLLTDVWRSRNWNGQFTTMPREAFHYASYNQIAIGGTAADFREAAYKAGALALHHWGHRMDDVRAGAQ